ncbi:MAG TPA: DUF4870 domain-containing protein [Thermoanaerobaculia bacterium]|nr:DUF4870 domain-containing protein [Thermoanaerobaculia bacterium]
MTNIPPPTVPPATPPPPGGGSYTPPPPPPPGSGAPASSDRTLWVILSYLGILSLIPYFAKKDDPDQEVRWHAKNGLALFLAEVAVWIVCIVLMMIMRRVPGLGCGVSIVQCVISLGFLALIIICIIKAVGGQRFRIPIITDFAEKNL